MAEALVEPAAYPKKPGKQAVLCCFICCYRERLVLWDGSLKIYSNKDKKQEAHEELLVILK
jgi:hypothetical protein